jgi:wyosine [tRNA(Phe)-imidazoG37] synthetase (radical SAM superfamily)
MLDQPNGDYSLNSTINNITKIGSNLVIQTMFVKWRLNDKEYNNADDKHVKQWLDVIKRINPPRVMIYTIDRDTPLQTMWKTPKERLDEIATLAKIFVPSVSISY